MEKYSRHKVEKKKYKQYRSPHPPPPQKKPTNPHKAAKNPIIVINKDQYFTDAIKISHVQCRIKESWSDAPLLNGRCVILTCVN